MNHSSLILLVRALDRSFHGPAWHGPTLTSALKSVDLEEASWRPGPDRHNIWELVLHCAYWKYRVCARLTELPRGSFGLRGSNFIPRPVHGTAQEWEADMELLRDWHRRLKEAVLAFDPDRLSLKAGGDRFTYEELIAGAGDHDIYHAGQIQLLKKLR